MATPEQVPGEEYEYVNSELLSRLQTPSFLREDLRQNLRDFSLPYRGLAARISRLQLALFFDHPPRKVGRPGLTELTVSR